MTWSDKAHQAGVFLTIGSGFVIPISTTLTDLFTTLALVCWFLAGHFKTFVEQVRSNPLVRAALLLFLVLGVGMIYTSAPFVDAGHMLKKYRELLFLMVFISFLSTERYRTLALQAFALAMVVALVASFYKVIFLLDPLSIDLGLGSPFKTRIPYSFLLAIFAFGIMTHILFKKYPRKYVMALSAIFILVTFNLFFMVNGRTGYVIFYLLGILLLIQKFKWRATYGLILFVALHFGLSSVSDVYKNRMDETIQNTQNYFKEGNSETAIGQRLEFMINGYRLLTERPVFGHGTGSFKSQYDRLAKARGLRLGVANPHNEFLMVGVQTGLIGIGFLIYFLYCLWRYAFQLSLLNKNLALGLAVATTAGCMINSILLDHTEGIFIIYFTAVFFSPLTHRGKPDNA